MLSFHDVYSSCRMILHDSNFSRKNSDNDVAFQYPKRVVFTRRRTDLVSLIIIILCTILLDHSKIVVTADLVIEMINNSISPTTIQSKSFDIENNNNDNIQNTHLAKISKTTTSNNEHDDNNDLFQIERIQLILPINEIGPIRRTRRLLNEVNDATTNSRVLTFHKYKSLYRNITDPDGMIIRNETIWHGSIQPSEKIESRQRQLRRKRYQFDVNDETIEEEGFCTFYSSNGIIQSGTITTENSAYDLIYIDDNDTYEIRTTFWNDFPENGIDDSDQTTQLRKHNGNYRSLFLQKEENRTMHKLLKVVKVIPDNDTPWIHDSSSKYYKQINNNNNRRVVSQREMNEEQIGTSDYAYQEMITIDALVVVSNRALCEYNGIKDSPNCPITNNNKSKFTSKIQLLQSETNNALEPINVKIRIVQILFLDNNSDDNAWDPISDSNSLKILNDNNEIQQYRDDTGADLVSLIAGAGGYCGATKRNTYKSIVSVACLAHYSFSHEIGHCLGAKHNREVMTNTKHPYSYAYRDPNGKYRTIDSYDCPNKTCPRVPFYSSSTMTLPDGNILGDDTIDNLRTIYDNALKVSEYRNTVVSASSNNNNNKNAIQQSVLQMNNDNNNDDDTEKNVEDDW